MCTVQGLQEYESKVKQRMARFEEEYANKERLHQAAVNAAQQAQLKAQDLLQGKIEELR